MVSLAGRFVIFQILKDGKSIIFPDRERASEDPPGSHCGYMKKYLYVVKTQIIKSMTYEFNVYGNIVMQTIIMITSACFWKALYKGQGMVGDVDADSMLTYVVLSSLLSVLLITNVERRIETSVVKGTVATDMMKPVNIFGIYFAEDIGNILALVFQNMLPILIIGSLMVKVPLMADLRDLPLFIRQQASVGIIKLSDTKPLFKQIITLHALT